MGEHCLNLSLSALLTQLRRDGGLWTSEQVARHWHPTWTVPEVRTHLRTLSDAGLLVRAKPFDDEWHYSAPRVPSPTRGGVHAQQS